MPYEILVFFGCVIASGFFSGSETAFVASDRLKLNRLASEGDHLAQRVLDLRHSPGRLLAGILVGNNIVNILAAVVAGAYFAQIYPRSEGLAALAATAVTTPIIVLFSEYLPKLVAALRPIKFARVVARPLQATLLMLKPVVWPLEMLTRPLNRLVGSAPGVGLAEVRGLLAEGVATGTVDTAVARVVHGGLSLEWKTVGDILVPRVDVVSVESGASVSECVEVFRSEGYSRLLVKEDSLDNDLGYIAAKDLVLLGEGDEASWTAGKAARESLRVPASLPLQRLLVQMRRSGVHLAVVKDEYGGTEGIVTLEDVLEEVVGEIRDEHDIEEVAPIRRLGRNVWLVRGDVSIRDVNDKLALDLPAGEARTIGGYVAEALGRVPAQADVVEGENVRLIVGRVEEKRVMQVRVVK